MPEHDPVHRSLAASIAANARWAMERDRRAATEAARRARDAKYEALVDPDGVLDPEERAKRVANARRADMQRLALKSAKARKRAGSEEAGPDAA